MEQQADNSIVRWGKQHLNWTWTIAFLLRFAVVPLESPTPFLIFSIIFIVVTLWVLYQKDRHWVWVFIPIAVLFLGNKRVERETDVREHRVEE